MNLQYLHSNSRYIFLMKFPTIGHTIYFHEEIKFPYFRLRLFLVADTRLYTLPCRSVRRSHFYIASGFCITAPAQLSATVLPCIRLCFCRIRKTRERAVICHTIIENATVDIALMFSTVIPEKSLVEKRDDVLKGRRRQKPAKDRNGDERVMMMMMMMYRRCVLLPP